MAKRTLGKRTFGIADLWRMALWGLAAAVALAGATYAGSSGIGRERVKIAFAEIHEALLPSGIEQPRRLTAQEERRLAETVRTLAAERDRLMARIATLEHSVEDMTGSIARVQKAAAEAAQRPAEPAPQPPPQPEAVPPATKPADDVTSSISTPSWPVPAPPAPAPSVAKPEFGLDLGSAPSVEALRVAWTAAVRKHGRFLEGLYPVVHMRERPRGGTEFRLIAGPLPNAPAAARACTALTAAGGGSCSPVPFEGQRLALH